MVKCSKLGESYGAIWWPSQKWGATTISGQKCTIDNCERNTQRNFNQNQKMVKCSKLWENSLQNQILPISKYHNFWSKTNFDMPFKIMGWYSRDLAVYEFSGQPKLGKGSNETWEKLALPFLVNWGSPTDAVVDIKPLYYVLMEYSLVGDWPRELLVLFSK